VRNRASLLSLSSFFLFTALLMPAPSTLHQLRVAEAELLSLPAYRVRALG